MRLGFSIRVYGSPNLPSHDGRSVGAGPSLSLSLAYLRDILHYARANDIHMYRMHSRLLPSSSAQELLGTLREIRECEAELTQLGELAREADVRLSFHPYSTIILNALNEDQVARSIACLEAEALLLDAIGSGPEAVIVLHVGGVYDDLPRSLARFRQRYEALPETIRRRLVLENDDRRFSHAEVRALHTHCGIPLVFDHQHHLVHNPDGIPTRDALGYSLSTWPKGIIPKVHFSTPRTEMRMIGGGSRVKVPTWTEHSDFISPFEFFSYMDMANGLDFDVMLEAKARDLALLKLRQDMTRFSPELARSLR